MLEWEHIRLLQSTKSWTSKWDSPHPHTQSRENGIVSTQSWRHHTMRTKSMSLKVMSSVWCIAFWMQYVIQFNHVVWYMMPTQLSVLFIRQVKIVQWHMHTNTNNLVLENYYFEYYFDCNFQYILSQLDSAVVLLDNQPYVLCIIQ